MAVHNDENGVWFSNDIKADKYMDSNPEDYKLLLQKLAELEDVRERMKDLRWQEAEILSDIHQLKPPYKATYGGIGVVTVAQSKSKKWDNESVLNHLMARARDARRIDKDTGEVLESEGQAVRRVIEQCAGIGYWRVTALREYGLEPDEFYETTSSKPSVRIEN